MAFVNPQVYGNLPCATLGHERRGGHSPGRARSQRHFAGDLPRGDWHPRAARMERAPGHFLGCCPPRDTAQPSRARSHGAVVAREPPASVGWPRAGTAPGARGGQRGEGAARASTRHKHKHLGTRAPGRTHPHARGHTPSVPTGAPCVRSYPQPRYVQRPRTLGGHLGGGTGAWRPRWPGTGRGGTFHGAKGEQEGLAPSCC